MVGLIGVIRRRLSIVGRDLTRADRTRIVKKRVRRLLARRRR